MPTRKAMQRPMHTKIMLAITNFKNYTKEKQSKQTEIKKKYIHITHAKKLSNVIDRKV